MDTLLEQNAIDQIFARRKEAGTGEGGSMPAPTYNFGRAGRISSEQMRSISSVNEQVARNLTHTLGAWLRTQVTVAAAAGEQMSFGDFLSCLPEPNFVCRIKLEPLGGIGLLEVSLSVALTMVDLLLGGKGNPRGDREVTDIESAILYSMLQIVMQELNAAWKPLGLTFELEKQETQASIAHLLPSSEQILCSSLDVQMPGVQGLINVCVPAMLLNTLHRSMSAEAEAPRRATSASTMRVESLMMDATLPVVLRLPRTRIASRELQNMQVGTVLELGLPKTTAAELLLNGVQLCTALPAAKGERLSAKLQGEISAMPVLATEVLSIEAGTVAA